MSWGHWYRDHKRDELPEEVKHTNKKKDTRHWCKGKKGIPHRPYWVPKQECPSYSIYECEVCKKILDYCFSWCWFGSKDKCKCGRHKEEPK